MGSSGKSENVHFDVPILSKVYYVWAKRKYRGVVSQHWRMIQNLKSNWLSFKKWHEEFGEFSPKFKSLQILTLVGFFWSKSIIFEVKKYRRDHYTGLSYWRSMQALKEKWSVVSLMTWGIWWTLPEHSKILKFALWEIFFPQGIKCWAKKFQMSCVSWHWRVMQCLKKNWLVVLKMT